MQQAPDLAVNDGRGLVVFLRGTWMHPRAWVSWQEHFDSNGYDSVIAGWTGTTHAPIAAGAAAPVSLADLLDGTAALVSDLRRAPILIGHGIGAVVAQVLLDRRASPRRWWRLPRRLPAGSAELPCSGTSGPGSRSADGR